MSLEQAKRIAFKASVMPFALGGDGGASPADDESGTRRPLGQAGRLGLPAARGGAEGSTRGSAGRFLGSPGEARMDAETASSAKARQHELLGGNTISKSSKDLSPQVLV